MRLVLAAIDAMQTGIENLYGAGSVAISGQVETEKDRQPVLVLKWMRLRSGIGRRVARAVGVAAVVCGAWLTNGALVASASSGAWWHLSDGEVPAAIQPGTARDEVMQLTVPTNNVEVIVIDREGGFPPVTFGVTSAQAVQTGLESLYGSGNVAVTGAVGAAGGSYGVTFVGGFADRRVEVPLAIGGTLSEVIQGRGDGQLLVTATNLGYEDTSASDATILADRLPAGLRATNVEAYDEPALPGGGAQSVTHLHCVLATLACSFEESLAPYRQIEMFVTVVAEHAVSGEKNEASISGGGTVGAMVTRPVAVGGAVSFGLENYELSLEEPGGTPDTQAGSHPYQLTNTITFNQSTNPGEPPALAKDVPVQLPAGLVGNPTPIPRCSEPDFLTTKGILNECPASTAIGVAEVRFYDPVDYGANVVTLPVPIFNLVPEGGEPARFGFHAGDVSAVLDTSVRTGTDYGVTVTAHNIPETVAILGTTLTFWGVPGEATHNSARGWSCIFDERYRQINESLPECGHPIEAHPKPFLSLPTSCTASLQTSASADSWQQPGVFASVPVSVPLPALVGCNDLPSNPALEVAPDGTAGATPTGLAIRVRVPQEVSLDSEGLAESSVEAIKIAFPAGMQLSPGGVNGLQACTTSEIGFTGINMFTHVEEFTPELASCPPASKIATAMVTTPDLPKPLTGSVYLASPQNYRTTGLVENPFQTLIATYLVVRDPESGVLVKLAGYVKATEPGGQLVATFEHIPDVPFEEAEIHLFGTARAPVSTPQACGTYTTAAAITPSSGKPAVTARSKFEINTGPNGSGPAGCATPAQFAPGFTAGSSNLQAGAFTPFTMTLTRPDQDQALGAVELQMPPGFSGDLSNVKLCAEPQASEGTCSPESLIGETTVSAGLGGDPYTVTGGKVYLTTGYKGGNFGLSIVNTAEAGPFVLQEGRPIVVRAALFLDRHTAAVRVVSDPLPTIIEGIPLQIQHVNVTLDREKFTFNPTNCKGMQVKGTLTSSEGATSSVSSPFQVTNCATLAFDPKLTASIAGRASKKDGASLHVKLTYPAGPYGAHIAKAKVDLPVQLPTEQRTLTKACLAKVFEADPANCPKYSVVGHAKAITPILPVPLVGPAYFVSYGGEKFPNLVVVLQGYGVTIDLVGTTFISKQGITSSTFNTVPDQPFNSFELTLPEGPYSALAANLPHGGQNFCSTKLKMPTAYVAQNGAEKHVDTPITVTGCAKPRRSKRPGARRPKHH